MEVLLEQWVLSDGNYGGGFRSGRTKRFAVRAEVDVTRPVRVNHEASVGARHLGRGAVHEITADVVHHADFGDEGHALVLDFGTRVYYLGTDPLLVGLSVGDRVVLTAQLFVDAYEYVESLAPRAGFPALVFTWFVERLERDEPSGSEKGWREVARTLRDAHDDRDETTYLLTCRDTGEPALSQR